MELCFCYGESRLRKKVVFDSIRMLLYYSPFLKLLKHVQSTPLNRITLVPEHFDPIKRNLGVEPIKRNLGVEPIKRSELILFLWFCSWPSDPINLWPKLNR